MSKSVRLKGYLADELEKVAARENRSLANLVNKLLEQALELDHRPLTREKVEMEIVEEGLGISQVRSQITTTPAAERIRTDADAESRGVRARTLEPVKVDDHFRPDPKPERKKK